MVRQVHVTVPNAKAASVMAALHAKEHVHDPSDYKGSSKTLIIFKCVEKHAQSAIGELEKLGVGVDYGSIDIVALQSCKPLLATFTKAAVRKRKYRITDRRSVEEIYQIVDEQSHLTFDYLLNISVAGLIAAMGLISDSSVTVVASMLVSPLMGPIVCITLGAVVSNHALIRRGVRNEIWGVVLTFAIGLLVGISTAPFYGPCGVRADWAKSTLQSVEITSRGTLKGLIFGLVTAVPSGVGVALAITGGGGNALVGVAIAASLLPPIVNAGIALSAGFFYSMCNVAGDASHPVETVQEAERFISIAGYSFLLFIVNFIVIFATAYGIFKLKRVTPWYTRSDYWRDEVSRAVSVATGLRGPGDGPVGRRGSDSEVIGARGISSDKGGSRAAIQSWAAGKGGGIEVGEFKVADGGTAAPGSLTDKSPMLSAAAESGESRRNPLLTEEGRRA